MAQAMTESNGQSPASRVMDEAIELAIEGRSPYPERAAFIDVDTPNMGWAIDRAIDDNLAVVLVSADGSTRILRAESPNADVAASAASRAAGGPERLPREAHSAADG